ncbi:MAG: hypothetical protein M3137_17040, partial [Actinomycetota bacterium]|nr:hypothetical protein [Actinomycetota bacterium]
GHVSADTDLHPASDPPLAQLEGNDLIPFSRAITAGAPVVLMSNAVVPGLTAGLPASLAPGAYAYLRVHLGFTGLAITDSLGAGAISGAGYPEPAATAAAVISGADMVFVNASDVGAATTALTEAVTAGTLPVAQLDASVGRILAVKAIAGCTMSGPVGGPASGLPIPST